MANVQVIITVVVPIKMQEKLDRDIIHYLQDPSDPLSTVMEDYESMFAFREFLKGEFSVENMDFCCELQGIFRTVWESSRYRLRNYLRLLEKWNLILLLKNFIQRNK